MKRKQAKSGSLSGAADAQAQALQRFRQILPTAEYEQLLTALAVPLRQAVRLNPLKVNCQPGAFPQDWQQRYGWQVEAVPYCDRGWWLTQADVPTGKTIEHRLGHYYIQDAASMLPVELFDFEDLPKEPLMLDMAASPGGKTTHLIARSGERELVIANDSSRQRITALRLVLQSWGGIHTAVTRFPGEMFGRWFPETFDYVLLDAPCSMESLHSSESRSMRPVSEAERRHLAKRQAQLLESAFRSVKPGGQVVYATCSLAPEEDEAVLDSLLKQFGGAAAIEDVQQRLPCPAPAMTSFQGAHFDERIMHAVRLYPHTCGTSGFFTALIRKTAAVAGAPQPYPRQPFERTGLAQLSPPQRRSLFEHFDENYGFGLEQLLEEQRLSLWKRGGSILAAPQLYLDRFAALACQSLGLPLAGLSAQGIEISHEWASRFAHAFKGGFYELPEEQLERWLRGEDIPLSTNTAQHEAPLMVKDASGRHLGRGKLQSNRLKNMLPRRLIL